MKGASVPWSTHQLNECVLSPISSQALWIDPRETVVTLGGSASTKLRVCYIKESTSVEIPLGQELANFFYKELDSIEFLLCELYGVAHNFSTLPLQCEGSIDYTGKWAWLCSNKSFFIKAGPLRLGLRMVVY